MKDKVLDAKGERMLELLAQGASNRLVAKRMGYTEGTMRVYLHNLYRKIGVPNKTGAVIWYLAREKARQERDRPPGNAAAAPRAASAGAPRTGDLFGDMALEEGLYAALGVMGRFVGPYGKVWEVARRLDGEEIDDELAQRQERSRRLWDALLRGDWAFGKRMFDDDMGMAANVDSPSDAVLLVSLLVAGGYSNAADRLSARLTDKRRGAGLVSAREAGLMRALKEALYANDAPALASLQKLGSEKSVSPTLRQVATALLFHVHAAQRDFERARQAANALWAEAEGARQHLQAMGERPFAGPATPKGAAKAGIAMREKTAATR